MTTAYPIETTARRYVEAAVPGALYRADWLGAGERAQIFEQVDVLGRGAREHCRDYGYGRAGRSIEYIGPLPELLQDLAERLSSECRGTPTQCTVETLPPLGSHRRSEVEVAGYGPVVAIVSLGAALVRFELVGEVGGKHRHEISLAPGSLLLLTGDSRYRWTYKIRPHDGQHEQRRILLTFRTLI